MIFKKSKNRMHSSRIMPPAPRQPAMNQVLVDLGKAYQVKSPDLLGPGINAARDFFINVIAPKITALDNGLQDGVEVLRLAMGEEPQAGKYFHALKSMMEQALQVRMASFISQQCELSDKECELFLSLVLGPRESNTPDKQLLAIGDLIKSLGNDAKAPGGHIEPVVNTRKQRRLTTALTNRSEQGALK